MTWTYRIENGDYVRDRRTGRPEAVTGRAKLRQDIRQLLRTATQRSGFGAGLDELLGRDVDPIGFRAEVAQAIRSAVVTLQQLQERYQTAHRSPEERVARIGKLQVLPVNLGGGTARTGYAFQLQVVPATGEVVSLNGTAR